MNFKFNTLLFLLILTMMPFFTYAQKLETQKIKFSGDITTDSRIISQNFNFQENPQINLENPEKKSPWLASAFSLVLPGAGEFYSGSYLKAGIFVAVEAALIATAVIYNNKGNKQTSDFQNYADKNWSVLKYARWLINFQNADSSQIILPNNPNLPPWERINWAGLNAAEVGSHRLPMHGEQQYFEEIGKYHEYSPGWDDYSYGANYETEPVSPHFEFYAYMRGHANDLYDVSTKAVVGIYLNHFLSALDAYWTTTMFNKEISMNMRVDHKQFAYHDELVPTLNFQVKF